MLDAGESRAYKAHLMWRISNLLDDEAHVYQKGLFSSQWHHKQGLFGPQEDTNLFGQPNVKRDLFGQPMQAIGWLLVLFTWIMIGLLVWLAPHRFQALLDAIWDCHAKQGQPTSR